MRTKDFKRHLARFNKCLTSSVRNPGTEQEERYYHFDTELCMGKEKKLNPYYETLSSFMYDLNCDNNSRYKYTAYAITTFIEQNVKSIQELEDVELDEIVDNDVDVYTDQLTGWLHASCNNVYYLTEALSEYGDIADGFQALTIAQSRCIYEIYSGIRDIMVKFLKSKE